MKELSIASLVTAARERGCRISDVVVDAQAEESGRPREELIERMRQNLQVMKEAVETGLRGDVRSLTGLSGGQAAKVERARQAGRTVSGGPIDRAVARALAVAEVNASMGRIVAAPTAGSCGVLPAVVLTVADQVGSSEDDVVLALFAAAGVGVVIADRATISGAEGGCQAECGSASAMAAAAGVEMAGGTPDQCAHASAIALKNVIGLACDPVAGLVEVPCVKRNAMAAAQAMVAIDLALAGVESVIPADEVIEAVAQVGRALPASLRETAQGGLAATPTARQIEKRVLGRQPDISL